MTVIEAEKQEGTAEAKPSESNPLLYGIVEWINFNPIWDGMEAYDTKERAVSVALEKEEMSKKLFPTLNPKVTYTVIRIERVI